MDFPDVLSTDRANCFTRMVDYCCYRQDEEQSLMDEEHALKCETLRNIVQHPVTLFLGGSTFGACATQLVTKWIMGGPGCDLSALHEGAALIVPLTLGAASGTVSIIGNLVQCFDDNRLITQAGNDSHFIEETFVSDVVDRCAAPCRQTLRNACKNPIVMGGEAILAGILFEFLLWPTILDSFNCDLSTISTVGVIIGASIALIAFAGFYFVGARSRIADRDSLVKLIEFQKKECGLTFERVGRDGQRSTYQFSSDEEEQLVPRLVDENTKNDFPLDTVYGMNSVHVGY